MIVTYVVTVFNKEKYIANVIESLKKIRGDFRKEFIFVDDGSTDSSLSLIQTHAKTLPRALIITQKNAGPAASVNKGIRLAHGEYIHFVDGDDVICPQSTEILLKASKDFGTDVAFGLRGKLNHEGMQYTQSEREVADDSDKEAIVIDSPIKEILNGKIPGIRSIGSSGSLVNRGLLDKISGADSKVFIQDMSISLRCAKYSKFIFVPATVSYSPSTYDKNNISHDKAFEAYNTLCAIANFMEEHQEVASKFLPELYKTLWSTVWKLDKYNVKTLHKYLLSKCSKGNVSFASLLKSYREEIKKLL